MWVYALRVAIRRTECSTFEENLSFLPSPLFNSISFTIEKRNNKSSCAVGVHSRLWSSIFRVCNARYMIQSRELLFGLMSRLQDSNCLYVFSIFYYFVRKITAVVLNLGEILQNTSPSSLDGGVMPRPSLISLRTYLSSNSH